MKAPGSIIYLIGFMGSGKSTVGKKLAAGLEWSFIDLDERIELETGMKISEIFFKKGEPYFREIESSHLHSLVTETNTVVSTGGGTPCFENNMKFMIETGLTIYLKMTAGQLKNRLSGSSGKRPLIKDVSKIELMGYIEEKLAERENWYNRAAIIVDGFNIDNTFLLSLVKKWIDN
jgi:shikimate kinase